jgi:polyribonucleotide nucleotidyltransferase
VSELSAGYVSSVHDVCGVGDEMKVLVIGVDEHDRVKLSRKRAMEELGLPDEMATQERPPRGEGEGFEGEGGGDGGGYEGGGERRERSGGGDRGGRGGGYGGGRGGRGGGDRGGRGGRGGGGGGGRGGYGGGGRGGDRDRR